MSVDIDLALRSTLASHAGEVHAEPGRLAAAARQRYRQRAHRRAALAAGAVAAVTGVGIAVPTALGGATDQPAPSRTGAHATTISAFTVAHVSRPALAAIDGVEITYLPGHLARYEYPVASNEPHTISLTYRDASALDEPVWDVDRGVTIGVTRAAGAGDPAGYRATHWLGAASATRVGGAPAIASAINSDGAHAVVWFPRPGLRIFVGTSGMSEGELRKIVAGVRVTGQ